MKIGKIFGVQSTPNGNVKITIEVDGSPCIIEMPRQVARKHAENIRRAADEARDPECTDADAHWHGHCGCK